MNKVCWKCKDVGKCLGLVNCGDTGALDLDGKPKNNWATEWQARDTLLNSLGTGVKHDQAKLKMGLISSRFLRGLADVLTLGAEKYAAHNWRKGMATSRYYDALQRHLTAWNDGETNDPEWGRSHLYHAACCLMFLAETVETRPDMDDRYKPDARNALSPAGSHPLPEEAPKHGDLPGSASRNLGDPRLPSVHVRPLCGVGVEEQHGPTEPPSGVQRGGNQG